MKQRETKAMYPVQEQVYNPNPSTLSDPYEYSYRQIENDGGYYYEFDEEYESYNSDYDLNTK
jgi:hypothetical protein